MTDLEARVEGDEETSLPCALVDIETRHAPHAVPLGMCPGYGIETVSYSEIDTFRQCPFKHKLTYTDRWTRESIGDMTPLGKGSFWHKVMEAHYRTIQEYQIGLGEYRVSHDELLALCLAAVEEVLAEGQAAGTDENLLTLARWMYAGHIERWGLDEDWYIVAVEHTAIVPLWNKDGSESWIRLKVKLDLVVTDARGRLCIVDHKSCGNLPHQKDLDFDEQFGLYTYVLKRMGKNVFMSIHNAARTKMNQGDIIGPDDPGYKKSMKAQTLEERFKRTLLNRTDPELQAIQDEALWTAETMFGPLNRQERHPNTDTCNWKCDFTEACLYGRRSNDNGKTVLMLMDTGWRQDPQRH